ncbi:MAG: serine/threonine protein kinase, partial [Planctomycetes bacterium]|nr:serine/threonine protein kinase [Planctomycetota bacterium]
MLRCPFCQADVDDAELRSGRCPNCGSLLAWNDEDDESQTIADSTDLESPTATLPEFERSIGGILHDVAADSDADDPSSTQPDMPGAAAGSSSSANRPLTPGESESLEKIWKRTISPETRANMTIKTEAEIGDTHFAGDSIGVNVPSRKVQHAQQPHEAPADYQVIEMIGEGGAAFVYSARQTSIDRIVAIKMMRPEAVLRNEERQKFLSEAIVTGDLDHPNIVPIHDLGIQDNGELFYSMKRVVGTPWSEVLNGKTQPENLGILMKVVDAVAFAHARGIVHRDLKPENVMLGDYGEVLLMDWGIALPSAEFSRKRRITETGSLGGTPAYMAPEIAKGP